MNSEQFDKMREQCRCKSKTSWPFRKMQVDDVVSVDSGTGGRDLDWIQVYIHNYGKQTGKKFETFTNDGKIHAKRVV